MTMGPLGARNFDLLTCMKDEGIYALEWIAYHKVIGFDRVLIASNDNCDGSADLLDALHAAGHIVHVDNILEPGQSPQLEGYKKLLHHPTVKRGDVVACIDADEFIMLKGHSTVHSFFADTAPEGGGIAIPWRHFGSSGNRTYSTDLVTTRFQQASNGGAPQDNHFKSIFVYNEQVRGVGIHRPHYHRNTPATFVDPSGATVPVEIMRGAHPNTVNFHLSGREVAQLNHYAVKSLQEYELRTGRGNGFAPERAGHFANTLNGKDRNEVSDATMMQYSMAVRGLIAGMLLDREVRAAAQKVEAIWAARVGTIAVN